MMQSNEEYLLLVLDKKTFFTTATTCEGVIIVYTSCHSFTNIREDKERPRSAPDESIGVVKYLFGPFYSRIFYCTIRIYYSSNIYIGVFPDCFSYVALNIMGIFPHISRWCYQGAVFFHIVFWWKCCSGRSVLPPSRTFSSSQRVFDRKRSFTSW